MEFVKEFLRKQGDRSQRQAISNLEFGIWNFEIK
jgi:hypothetical protein